MSKIVTGTIICPQCQSTQEVESYASINVTLDPELRKKFLAQEINIFECKNCGLKQPIETELMYHEMDKGFVVYIVPDGNFEATKQQLDTMPSFGGAADYMKHPLFVKTYQEGLLMVHLCEKNGAPKTQEERDKYYQAYADIKAMYEQAETESEHTPPREPFDLLDAYKDEAYAWSGEALRVCSPLTGLRTDLVPYAMAMLFDDFIHIVMGYPDREWEDTLDEAFGDHEEVWEQIYTIRSEVFRLLKERIGIDAIVQSLEELTETTDPDEPDVTSITLSDTQRLRLRQFVEEGFAY